MSWLTRLFRPDPFAVGIATYVPPVAEVESEPAPDSGFAAGMRTYVPPVLPEPEPVPEPSTFPLPTARLRAERDKTQHLVKARYGLSDGDAGKAADEITIKALQRLGRLPEVKEGG